jgi:hypothetical protein
MRALKIAGGIAVAGVAALAAWKLGTVILDRLTQNICASSPMCGYTPSVDIMKQPRAPHFVMSMGQASQFRQH